MTRRALCAVGLVVGLALVGLGQVEIPLPTGAVMRLGLGSIAGNVVFSRDGRYLAVGTTLGVELRDAETLELVRFFSGHTRGVLSVAFSPDGTTLASGSWDETIKLWDAATGRELRTLSGHTGYVYSVAFSPDGKLLASGSEDSRIKLWEVGTGKELRTLSGHTGGVISVAFSPDGKALASGSGDGTALLWDLTFLVPQPPAVVALAFPGAVFTGVETRGTIRFADPNADLVRAEFTVAEGPLPGFTLDLTQPAHAASVGGQAEGSFAFSLTVREPGRYRIRVTLVDATGLRSAATEFSFQATTPTAPRIVRVTFPSSVTLNHEQNGLVRYEDPDGDIVRAEFTVVEGDPAKIQILPASVFDPEVRGTTSGSFRFTVNATKTQTVKLRLVLVDAAGLRSEPVEFTFRVE